MFSEDQQNAAHPEPVSVILIAYNEAEVIEREVEGFYREVVEKVTGSELIVAEDGSTDGTSEILRKLAERLPIRLVQGPARKGYKRALLDALKLPRCEWVFFSDTGGKFYPENFWKLEKLRDRADLIIGVKKNRRDQYYRRLITLIFNFLVRVYFRVRLTDIDSGFRIFPRELALQAVERPLIFQDLITSELTLRMVALGARVTEVPVNYYLRQGKSRGMPFGKIPQVVVRTIASFPKLKKEFREFQL